MDRLENALCKVRLLFIKAYPEDFNRNWQKAWGIDS
jgi:hypothetical protein